MKLSDKERALRAYYRAVRPDNPNYYTNYLNATGMFKDTPFLPKNRAKKLEEDMVRSLSDPDEYAMYSKVLDSDTLDILMSQYNIPRPTPVSATTGVKPNTVSNVTESVGNIAADIGTDTVMNTLNPRGNISSGKGVGEIFDARKPSGTAYRSYKPMKNASVSPSANIVPASGQYYVPNWTMYSGAPKQTKTGLFEKLKNAGSGIADDIAYTAGNFFNPSAGGGISYGFNPWSATGRANIPKGMTGLNIGKFNVGKWSNIANGVMQGVDAISGLSEMSNLNKDADELTNDIIASASGNPLLHSYLTSDDLALLGKIQRGNFDATGDFGDATSNLGNLFSGAASGAMKGALGGLPGMLIGGIGGLVNSGIDNINSATSNNTARLESLYQNLLNAEQQYKAMRRPNFTGLGIQQRYQNMYA